MTRSSIRITFCLAVAVIAAAIADPAVEYASNAGWFGRGNFTDHSNLDVFPALLIGLIFAAVYAVQKYAGILSPGRENALRASNRALGNDVVRLLPLIFLIQILALYAMEASEQVLVRGHLLGGTIWLGGPVIVSLAAHAVTCVLVAFAVAKTVRTLAKATLHVICTVRALATLPQPSTRVTLHDRSLVRLSTFGPVLCSIGERGPPLFSA